tara:strand:+ start:465 stop:1823 length:1359 start_codon:yes stop_codon:yes gene_type:complete
MNSNLPNINNCKISIIGLGYVGLPLALAFADNHINYRNKDQLNRKVIGFDINQNRINNLLRNIDDTRETQSNELLNKQNIIFTSEVKLLSDSDVFIVTVPTPVDKAKNPDLTYLKNACKIIGLAIKKQNKVRSNNKKTKKVIIFESTVYPGATEEFCAPIIEHFSFLKLNDEFVLGYSPERVNPGDKEHRLKDIIKITSGSTNDSAIWIDNLYSTIIKAGTHKCISIKVAEAAKVIENTQRDLNIALINELSIIFNKLNINTFDVLEAASTKWNFIPFKPGLVGGHCIGVDPYYLTFKAEQINYYPEIILAGRRINDSMASWFADQLILNMSKNNIQIGCSNVLVMGLSFKENCPDIRNTKVIDLIKRLNEYNINTFIYDPIVDKEEAKNAYSLDVLECYPNDKNFTAIVIAVAHNVFKAIDNEIWKDFIQKGIIVFDIKGILSKDINCLRI